MNENIYLNSINSMTKPNNNYLNNFLNKFVNSPQAEIKKDFNPEEIKSI